MDMQYKKLRRPVFIRTQPLYQAYRLLTVTGILKLRNSCMLFNDGIHANITLKEYRYV